MLPPPPAFIPENIPSAERNPTIVIPERKNNNVRGLFEFRFLCARDLQPPDKAGVRGWEFGRK
jgi:hypothetical protein